MSDLMNIEQIEQLWSADSKIDQSEIKQQSLDVSSLHSKYYNILIREKFKLVEYQTDLKLLQKLKFEYYTGTLDQQTLKEKGWKPFALKVFKDNLQIYYDSDQDLIDISIKIQAQSEKVKFIDSILVMIMKNRIWQLRTALDVVKFEHGVM